MTSCCPQLLRELNPRRGTTGTVGTMVPICVGDRENRGPSDHARTIFYMSRATPEKRKGWPAWLRLPTARPRPRSPSPAGTMVLAVPTVPTGVEDLFRRRRQVSRVWEVGSPRCTGAAGTISPRWSRGGDEIVDGRGGPLIGAPRDLFVRVTPGSASFGSVRRSPQPAVAATARYPAGRMSRHSVGAARLVVTGVVPGERGRAPLDAHFGFMPSVRGDHADRNNCWRFSPVFSFCF
jgi:hypothetical protein